MKCSAFSFHGFEKKRAVAAFDDRRVRECEALSRSFADILGGKERIENAMLDLKWNSTTTVLDHNSDRRFVFKGRDRNLAHSFLLIHIDRMSRVYDQVDQNLTEFAGIAKHFWQVV